MEVYTKDEKKLGFFRALFDFIQAIKMLCELRDLVNATEVRITLVV